MSAVRGASGPSSAEPGSGLGSPDSASSTAGRVHSISSAALKDLPDAEVGELREFLAKAPLATPFHSLEWNSVLSSEYGLNPSVSIARAEGRIIGCNFFYTFSEGPGLRTVWSPPRMYEAVYGGPVCLPGFESSLGPLLEHQEKLSRGHTSYVVTPPGFDSRVLSESDYSVHGAKTVLLDLRGTENELWSKIGSTRRNDIRRAEKKGVEVDAGDLSQIEAYHEMLCDTLGRSGRGPLKPSFFSKLLGVMVPLGCATFLVAQVKGQPVAGAIMLHFGSMTLYWSGASSEQGRGTAANVLVQWMGILDAGKRGSLTYDFLGIDPRLPGVSAFKEGFGGGVVGYCSAVKRTPFGEVVRAAGGLRHPGRAIRRLLRNRK